MAAEKEKLKNELTLDEKIQNLRIELIERMKNDGILDSQNNDLEKFFDDIFN